ncbi:unnamed protein product, partial [marine sediment metagenome]
KYGTKIIEEMFQIISIERQIIDRKNTPPMLFLIVN